jgi:phage head maturation protease
MQTNLMQFEGVVEIQAASAGDGTKQPKIFINAYNGGLMKVGTWGTVAIDLKGLQLPASAMPILVDHNSNIDGIAGSGTPSVVNNRLDVVGHLAPSSQSAQKLIALSKAGVSFGASVGVEPIRHEYVKAGTTIVVNGRTIKSDRDFVFVRAGALREVSLVSVPADSSTSVSIAANLQTRGKTRMTTEIQDSGAAPVAATVQANVDPTADIRAKAVAELTRISEIQRICASNPAYDITMTDAVADIQAKAIAEGWSMDKADAAVIRATTPKSGPAIHASNRQHGEDDVMQAALLVHLGHESTSVKACGERTTQVARDLRLNSLHDILRCSLSGKGVAIPNGRDEMIKAAFSTASVANVLSNVANKISTEAYRAVPSVARVIARKLTTSDFKQHVGIQLTGDANFEQIAPDGKFKHGVLSDSVYSYRVDTFGKMFGLTRQDIRNDDLGKFEEVPRLLGRGAANKLESLFWTLVLANTNSFFSSGNGNYMSGAETVLGIYGLAAGVQIFRDQVDDNGDPIMVSPKYLVVPTTLEVMAWELFKSTSVVAAGDTDLVRPDGQVFAGKYEPQVSPFLNNANYTGNSEKAWYLFGDPSDVAAFGICYLDGVENPIIEQREADFNELGVQFRGYIDFGVCQIDPRGAVKSKGEG